MGAWLDMDEENTDVKHDYDIVLESWCVAERFLHRIKIITPRECKEFSAIEEWVGGWQTEGCTSHPPVEEYGS